MTVTSTNQKVQFNGNGSTTVFAYNFKIFAQTDLSVILRSAAGTETVQQLTTKYTVSGVGVASGGNVTMGTAPASGTTLTILRVQPNLQGLDLVPNDPFPAGSMEDALDKLTFMVQTHDEEIGRSIKASTTNTIGNTEFTVSATDRANKLFSFDSSGNLAVTAGKVDTVTASATAVSTGGSPTASATYTASSGALALAFGVVTGANGTTGNSAGLQMTFSNSTSDADPGAGKLALNNGTVSSVNQLFFDDADDNGTSIASFVQSFDDVSNATGRGIIQIEKEGTASTFALFKVTGAVVDAAGYSKVPVSHLVSNGSFSNADGIRVDFSYSGNDGAGSLTEVVQDTSPELGGNLDVLARDIVSSSNRPIDLAPGGTGTVVIRGNDNPGTIVLNCESNTHGQTIKAQPHSASVTNTMILPAGANSTLVSLVSTDTLTNKTLTSPKINGSVAVTASGTELNYTDITTLGLSQASKAVTADANGVITLDNGFSEEYAAVTSSSNAIAINLRTANNFSHTLTENTTISFANPAASGKVSAFTLKIIQASSAKSITWHSSIKWAGDTAPTLSTGNGNVDVFTGYTVDGGTNYYMFTAGQVMS